MRIGVFSDVHGNIEALESVLAHFAEMEVTEFLCLGDIVGYGANPNECITRIRELRAHVVAGNHDYATIGRTSTRSFNGAAIQAIEWTRSVLTAESRAFLTSLELVELYQDFHLVHASPSAPQEWDYILSAADIGFEFGAFSERICLVGHSHIPLVLRRHVNRPQPQLILEPEFDVTDNAKYLINAGSVGQPRDGNARSCALVYDTRSGTVSFVRVPYDIGAAQRRIRAAGLPGILAERLSLGR